MDGTVAGLATFHPTRHRHAMDVPVDEKAVAALESLYSGPTTTRQLAQSREIFAFLRNEGQVRSNEGCRKMRRSGKPQQRESEQGRGRHYYHSCCSCCLRFPGFACKELL